MEKWFKRRLNKVSEMLSAHVNLKNLFHGTLVLSAKFWKKICENKAFFDWVVTPCQLLCTLLFSELNFSWYKFSFKHNLCVVSSNMI